VLSALIKFVAKVPCFRGLWLHPILFFQKAKSWRGAKSRKKDKFTAMQKSTYAIRNASSYSSITGLKVRNTCVVNGH